MKKRILSTRKIAIFRKKVYQHYSRHKRDLPWRKTVDPYHIYISEIMLQQTQVDRVAQKFPKFIKAFPNWKSLAYASTERILKEWQGLGYNRRALFLKYAAEKIINEFDGILPINPELLLSLPGIGKATAASIAAFAFNKPTIFIETNIRSVFIHHFFPGKSSIPDEQLYPLVEQTMDTRHPCKWYSALMDYGTMLKKKHANPSRRSAHHAKQSKFEGSNRQLRGSILKLILKKGAKSLDQLMNEFAYDKTRLKHVLAGLCREGFISYQNKVYSVAR